MKVWVVALGVLVAGCGGAAPVASSAQTSTIELPEAKPAAESTGQVTASPETRAQSSGSFLDCVAALRRAQDLSAEPAEREHYEQGLAAEERGELSSARKQYYLVIERHPRSRLIPLAYLAFGELFAQEAAADPTKWELANAAYGEVAKYPPPENTAYGYSLLRLGDSRLARDDQQALSHYMKAMDAVAQYPALPCAEAVRQKAEEGLVEAYIRAGQPDRAWAFFRAKTGEARARVLLGELAARYKKAGKPAEACAAARGAGSDAAAAELTRSVCP